MMIKKALLSIPLLLITCMVSAKSVSTFFGEKFKAEIEYSCDEGEVTCEKVMLKSTSLKNGSSITLKGNTINTNCPDVCDFQGYEFPNGDYLYSFYPNVDKKNLWDYIVTRKGKVILQDSGKMD